MPSVLVMRIISLLLLCHPMTSPLACEKETETRAENPCTTRQSVQAAGDQFGLERECILPLGWSLSDVGDLIRCYLLIFLPSLSNYVPGMYSVPIYFLALLDFDLWLVDHRVYTT